MPNRIIKESINESRGLTCCTFFAQDLYKRLITYADDYGRYNADPQIMLARLYPRELDVVSLDDIMDGIIELTGIGKIAHYTSAPRKDVYGSFPNWEDHQRMRDSKRRLPEPTDTTVNDWYLRRFIPADIKVEVVNRANYKCQICNKHIGSCDDAKRIVKMGAGLFHIDHIVPCDQGGRATLDNLRLVCTRCSQTRKKRFTFDEIVSFADSRRNSPQLAATRRNSPPESNPIQSESESESNTESVAAAPAPVPKPQSIAERRFDEFWGFYPKKIGKGAAAKAYQKIKPDDALHKTILAAIVLAKKSRQWTENGGQYIPNPATWLNQGRWEDEPDTAERSDTSGANHRQGQAGNAGRCESAAGSAGDRYKPDPAEVERIARERGILP